MTAAGPVTTGLSPAPDRDSPPGESAARDAEQERPAGLRERKKLATRQALGQAAMRLAIERGLDSVLVEDIAAAANVSARTFSNYFSSKYEAICALMLDRSYRIGQELRARPACECLWDAIRHSVLAVYEAAGQAPHPEIIEGIRLVTSSPALRGEYLKALSVAQYELAGAIAERSGAGTADPYFTRGLAAAVISAVQAATERWLWADPPVALAPLVDAALRDLAEGMRAALSGPGQPGSATVSPAENDAPPERRSG